MLPGQPVVVDIHAVDGKRPDFDVYIGRAVKGTEFTSDSKWANIYPVEKYGNRSLSLYMVYAQQRLAKHVGELTDKVLGCWCGNFDSFTLPPKCHGQVLIKLWIDYSSSKCVTSKCPYFKNGFCTYNVLGCYLDDEGIE